MKRRLRRSVSSPVYNSSSVWLWLITRTSRTKVVMEMAEELIQDLQIKMTAQADSAVQSIAQTVKMLKTLRTSMEGIPKNQEVKRSLKALVDSINSFTRSSGNIDGFGDALQNMAKGLSALKKNLDSTAKLVELSNAVEQLSSSLDGIDGTKFGASAASIGKGLSGLAKGAEAFGKTSVDLSSLDGLSPMMSKIKAAFDKFDTSEIKEKATAIHDGVLALSGAIRSISKASANIGDLSGLSTATGSIVHALGSIDDSMLSRLERYAVSMEKLKGLGFTGNKTASGIQKARRMEAEAWDEENAQRWKLASPELLAKTGNVLSDDILSFHKDEIQGTPLGDYLGMARKPIQKTVQPAARVYRQRRSEQWEKNEPEIHRYVRKTPVKVDVAPSMTAFNTLKQKATEVATTIKTKFSEAGGKAAEGVKKITHTMGELKGKSLTDKLAYLAGERKTLDVEATTHSGDGKMQFKTTETQLSHSIRTASDLLKSDMKPAVDSVTKAFEPIGKAVDGIKEKFKDVGLAVKSIVGSLKSFKENVSSAFAGIQSGDTVGTIVSIGGAMASLVAGPFGALVALLPRILSGLGSIASMLGSVIAKAIKGLVGLVGSIISGILNAVKGLISGIVNLVKGAVSTIFNLVKGAVQLIGNAIKGILSIVSFVVTNAVKLIAGTVKTVVGVLGKILSPIFSMIGNVAGRIKNGFVTLITSPFTSAYKTIVGLNKAIDNLVSRFIRVSVFRAFRSAISSVGKALDEGRKNLYEFSAATSKLYSAQYAKNMDAMATSMLTFKNSIAAAVSPIMNTFIPVINAAVNAVVTLLNAVNQLFAALTGSSVFTKATTAATKYSAAASGAGSATKGLLADWDELNIIQNSGGGGGGGGGPAISSMFTEENIDSGIADFAAQLREAFDNGDWKTLGSLLGDKFNEIIKNIPWKSVGKQVGYYLSGVISTAYNFLKRADFVELGKGIAEFINGAIENMDTEDLGRLLSRKITAIWDFAIGLLSNVKWGKLGDALGKLVRGAFDELGNWFKSKKNWEQMGRDFIAGITEFFGGLSITETANSFSSFIGDALVAGFQFLKGSLGDLWERIKAFYQPYIDEAGGNVLLGILNGSASLIGPIKEWVKTNIIDPIDDAFEEAFGIRPLEGILTTLKTNLLNPIKTTIIDPIAGYFSGLGIDMKTFLEDPVGSIKTVWNDLKNKFFKGFTNQLSIWLDYLGTKIFEKLGNKPEDAKKKWEELKGEVKEIFNAWTGEDGVLAKIGKAITDFVEDPVGTVNQAFVNVLDWLNNNYKTICEDIDKAFNVKLGTTETVLGSIGELFSGMFTWLTENLPTIGDYIKEFMADPVGAVKSAWSDVCSFIIKQLNEYVVPAIAEVARMISNITGRTFEVKFITKTVQSKSSISQDLMNKKDDQRVYDYSLANNVLQEYTNSKLGAAPGDAINVEPEKGTIGDAVKAVTDGAKKMETGYNKLVDDTADWIWNKAFPRELGATSVSRKFADGGLPPVGELYVARESGPELIGRLGNHSNAVMNNEQLIDSVARGFEHNNDREVALLEEIARYQRALADKEWTIKPSAALGRVNSMSAQMYGRTVG